MAGISNVSSMMNSKLRFSGLATGLDTDNIIKQMMRLEQAKVDKVRQQRTLLEWRRDDYRSITNSLRGFMDEYFDVLKPATNMRSLSAFSGYKVTYNGSDTAPASFTATAGSGAIPGNYKISNIKLMEVARALGRDHITGGVTGTAISTGINTISKDTDNNKITVTFNGVSKEITLDEGLNGIDAVIGNLNTKLEAAFGAGKITVGKDAVGDKLTFTTANTNTLSLGYAYNNGYNQILGTGIASNITLDNQNNKFTLSYNDGTAETVALDVGTYSDANAVVAALQNKIDSNAALAGKNIKAFNVNNRVVIRVMDGTTGSADAPWDTKDTKNGMEVTAGSNIMKVTIGGVTKELTLKAGTYNREQLLGEVQSKLDAAFGANKVMVSSVSSDGGTTENFKFEGVSATNTITAGKKENAGLVDLGLVNGNTTNKISFNAKLADIKTFFSSSALAPSGLTTSDTDGDGNDIEFKINDVLFQFKSSEDTLSSVMAKINGDPTANVKMTYDSINDKFMLESKQLGAVGKVKVDTAGGDGNLMQVLGLESANASGRDASIDFEDDSGAKTITRASNDFTVNGITFSLKAEDTNNTTTIKVAGDATKTVDLIKGFINKYNELIDKINAKTGEKRPRTGGDKGDLYLPLTDEQKQAMSETDVKLWEEKAKKGLMYRDSLLTDITYTMRKALYDPIEGLTDPATGKSMSLFSIGIETGGYETKGKLVIKDEQKLKDAIINTPDLVAKLFGSESSTAYSPDTKSAVRYNQNGIANRLYDILQDNIRTTRDNQGNKGLLLQKAGIPGDITDIQNAIADEMKTKSTVIEDLLYKMSKKEEKLYQQFAALEAAIGRMNSQSAWLSQQAGG